MEWAAASGRFSKRLLAEGAIFGAGRAVTRAKSESNLACSTAQLGDAIPRDRRACNVKMGVRGVFRI
jgi:hypothetical protein